MQKIVNVLAVSSAVVSLAVVGGGAYLFVNKDAIIQGVTDKAMNSVLGGLSPAAGVPDVGGAAGLGVGANDLVPSDTPQASADVPAVESAF